MKKHKRLALVAHDNRKSDLIEWVEWNWKVLSDHQIICTGTTGKLVEEALKKRTPEGNALKFKIKKLKSGPLGGDQQLGAKIAEGKIDMIIFFWGSDGTTTTRCRCKSTLKYYCFVQCSHSLQQGNCRFYYLIKLI